MTRSEVINHYIRKHEYKSYLEIGVENGVNFKKINFEYGVGVDPDPGSKATHKMTSDEFFKHNKEKFDCIFVDGLHESNQVLRDLKNSADCLTKGGMILVHDCNPPEEIYQRVPAETRLWWGDVWRAWLAVQAEEKMMIDVCSGIGVLRGVTSFLEEPVTLSYHMFDLNRKAYLRYISFYDWQKKEFGRIKEYVI